MVNTKDGRAVFVIEMAGKRVSMQAEDLSWDLQNLYASQSWLHVLSSEGQDGDRRITVTCRTACLARKQQVLGSVRDCLEVQNDRAKLSTSFSGLCILQQA